MILRDRHHAGHCISDPAGVTRPCRAISPAERLQAVNDLQISWRRSIAVRTDVFRARKGPS